jgi:hypothetical protein
MPAAGGGSVASAAVPERAVARIRAGRANSTEQQVRARVPGVRCETLGGVRSCHTGAFNPGQRITDFQIRRARVTRITVGIVID